MELYAFACAPYKEHEFCEGARNVHKCVLQECSVRAWRICATRFKVHCAAVHRQEEDVAPGRRRTQNLLHKGATHIAYTLGVHQKRETDHVTDYVLDVQSTQEYVNSLLDLGTLALSLSRNARQLWA